MKTTATGTTAAQVNESKNSVNNVAMPAGEYGDLCYDYFGKSSVIVFGNTDDHAAQLEAIGGKYSDRLRYSPLQNGRKWTEKQGRTAGYYFSTEDSKREAVQYVQRINTAILTAAARKEGETVKPAQMYRTGDRVTTIYGKGTIIEGTSNYSDRCRRVRLDHMTYNYGWKGMPQIFIEVKDEDMKPDRDGEDSTAYHRRAITEAAAMGCAHCMEHQGKRIEVTAAYKNGHDDPTGWTYCVSWYQGKTLKECENGVTLDQSARHMAYFERMAAKGWTLDEILYGEAA